MKSFSEYGNFGNRIRSFLNKLPSRVTRRRFGCARPFAGASKNGVKSQLQGFVLNYGNQVLRNPATLKLRPYEQGTKPWGQVLIC